MKTHIKLKVRIEHFHKGENDVFSTENFTIEADVEDRRDVYYTLMKEFGRCYGSIPMGYKFGQRTKYDDGSEGFCYSTVIIIEGAKPANGFILGE